jgi:hypothetical protein
VNEDVGCCADLEVAQEFLGHLQVARLLVNNRSCRVSQGVKSEGVFLPLDFRRLYCHFWGGTSSTFSISDMNTASVFGVRAAFNRSVLTIKRRKDTDKFKTVGTPLDLYGDDELLASGTWQVDYIFQALDGISNYDLVAILTTASGGEAQSAVYSFSTNPKTVGGGGLDSGPPGQSTITNARWKNGHSHERPESS